MLLRVEQGSSLCSYQSGWRGVCVRVAGANVEIWRQIAASLASVAICLLEVCHREPVGNGVNTARMAYALR